MGWLRLRCRCQRCLRLVPVIAVFADGNGSVKVHGFCAKDRLVVAATWRPEELRVERIGKRYES